MSVYRLSELIWIWNHVQKNGLMFIALFRIACSFNYFSRCHWTEFWQHNSTVSNGHGDREKDCRFRNNRSLEHFNFLFQINRGLQALLLLRCNILHFGHENTEQDRVEVHKHKIFLHSSTMFVFILFNCKKFSLPNLDKFFSFRFNYVEKRLVEIGWGRSPYTPCEVNPHRNVFLSRNCYLILCSTMSERTKKLCFSAYEWNSKQHRPSLRNFFLAAISFYRFQVEVSCELEFNNVFFIFSRLWVHVCK